MPQKTNFTSYLLVLKNIYYLEDCVLALETLINSICCQFRPITSLPTPLQRSRTPAPTNLSIYWLARTERTTSTSNSRISPNLSPDTFTRDRISRAGLSCFVCPQAQRLIRSRAGLDGSRKLPAPFA